MEEEMDRDFDQVQQAASLVSQETQDFNAVFNHAMEDMAAIGPVGQYAPAETLGPEPSFWEQAGEFLMDKFLPEIGDMLMQQGAKGAAEISQALFSHANSYVAYGYTQRPMEVESTIESPMEMGNNASFDAILAEASQRGGQEISNDLER